MGYKDVFYFWPLDAIDFLLGTSGGESSGQHVAKCRTSRGTPAGLGLL